jgi:phosphoribosylaminoimidazole carboxylase (NCAIR synthetase)
VKNKRYTFNICVKDYYYAYDGKRQWVKTYRRRTVYAQSLKKAREKLRERMNGYEYKATLIKNRKKGEKQ